MCCCCCRCLRCCRLWHVPEIRGALPPGGLLGSVISNELRTGFNLWGANLVVIAILITALFMTTRFSFSGAHAWAEPRDPFGAVEKLGILQKVQARWHGLARRARRRTHAAAFARDAHLRPQARESGDRQVVSRRPARKPSKSAPFTFRMRPTFSAVHETQRTRQERRRKGGSARTRSPQSSDFCHELGEDREGRQRRLPKPKSRKEPPTTSCPPFP